MLAKKYRFHSRGGVRHTYQKGKTIRSPKLSLIYVANDRGFQRFGVVVSKKIEKTAVKRNRIRRRIYEAVRAELPSYPVKNDCLFVVYSKDLLTMPHAELCALVHSLLAQSMV
ncbi:ribonuclease P protein component [Candidatus Saccharibacteria bacterium]|nr:ribonuclease P protein component [Candidatus Saccharibacteria bacterium]